MLTARERSQMPSTIEYAVSRGWIKPTTETSSDTLRGERQAAQRLCMARLRAEQRGQDTSKFPPRIRRRRKSKFIWYPEI